MASTTSAEYKKAMRVELPWLEAKLEGLDGRDFTNDDLRRAKKLFRQLSDRPAYGVPGEWSALPLEIQKMIVKKIDPATVTQHRAGLRRLGKAFAEELYANNWELSDDAFIVVKGLLEMCERSARNHQRLTTDLYSKMYHKVMISCTEKYPKNLTDKLYKQLVKQLPPIVKELGEEEREEFSRLVGHGFGYIDRFYVKRLKLATVREVCDRR